ncbi:MAG TPA: single-stranded-DNA-specific exonuclease RecJ [Candidatus Limnocylindrales bacterium]|nr:single-stranded-DNA-specific exonuclease RecJ [Candidatus Limnocylindrales bacterium]
MSALRARHRWTFRASAPVPADLRPVAAVNGLGERALALLVARGIDTPEALVAFLAEPRSALHDPGALPDAGRVVERVALARERAEPVVVFADFDADGLTGLAVLARTLGSLGLAVEPYVPSRLDEGHGLSLGAIEVARRIGSRLIMTVDTGSTSGREVDAAAAAGIDVVVTDHHRVPPVPPAAVALVNPNRPDAVYPDRRLSGAGVAFKVAQLLTATLGHGSSTLDPLDLTDFAAIGTVADLAPVLGENRAIARLGLERLRSGGHAGLAALLSRAGIASGRTDLETIAFAIAPRLNAAGRVGDATEAARLLLTDDVNEATALAERLEAANAERRELTRAAAADARAAVVDGSGPVIVSGSWPVGIIGLVASRLVDDTGRTAIVATRTGDILRASCRSPGELDLAAALEACADLFERHGGHPGAAGFEITAERWDEFRERFAAVAAALTPGDDADDTGARRGRLPDDPRRPLAIDLALPRSAVDYPLLRDLARLEPTGPGHPEVLLAIAGLTVARVRPTQGGHTQLTLRRDPDVLDAIAFGRADLPDALREGDPVDVVARLASRSFGGYESLQLEVRDIAAHGVEPELGRVLGPVATGAAA